MACGGWLGGPNFASGRSAPRGLKPRILNVDKIVVNVDFSCNSIDNFVTLYYNSRGEDASIMSTQSFMMNRSNMVVQLTLQFQPFADAASKKVSVADFNPCKGCDYSGMCDSDECAMKCYPLDAPFAPTLFPNLGVFVDFLKKHGWR